MTHASNRFLYHFWFGSQLAPEPIPANSLLKAGQAQDCLPSKHKVHYTQSFTRTHIENLVFNKPVMDVFGMDRPEPRLKPQTSEL